MKIIYLLIALAFLLGLAALADWLENEANKSNERNERTNGLRERIINFFINY